FSSRRRHTRLQGDWSSDVCSSDLSATSCWKVVGCGGVASESDCLASSALTFSWSSLTCWTRRLIVSRSLELLACARPMPVNKKDVMTVVIMRDMFLLPLLPTGTERRAGFTH